VVGCCEYGNERRFPSNAGNFSSGRATVDFSVDLVSFHNNVTGVPLTSGPIAAVPKHQAQEPHYNSTVPVYLSVSYTTERTGRQNVIVNRKRHPEVRLLCSRW
jgi:hypothetical protein